MCLFCCEINIPQTQSRQIFQIIKKKKNYKEKSKNHFVLDKCFVQQQQPKLKKKLKIVQTKLFIIIRGRERKRNKN